MPARRRNSGSAHDGENLERWLITYADMITLLMAFFIMMYAMSIVNLGKFRELAVSVRTGFGGDRETGSPVKMDYGSGNRAIPPVLPSNSFELMTTVAKSVAKRLPKKDRESIEYLSEGATVTVRVRADDVLFARGSADLSPDARRILRAVAAAVAPLPYPIRVEGHTCDLPIYNARFPSNWELSAQRAINVLLYMLREGGISPSRLAAVGYADTKPAVPNDSEANRARNRRIDIVLLRTEGSSGPGHAPTPVPGAPVQSPGSIRPAPVNLLDMTDTEGYGNSH